MNRLQKALKTNALFSSISGLTMILLNSEIAKVFGVENNKVFWIVGLILIYFAFTIWYEIGKQRKIAVIWIIVQDFLWVVGSLILLMINPFNITITGNIIIAIIALIVLLMAINQLQGLRKVLKT